MYENEKGVEYFINSILKRNLLTERRMLAFKSQLEVATELGISQPYYGMIERGYKVPKEQEVREQLIQMFDLPSNYFEVKRI